MMFKKRNNISEQFSVALNRVAEVRSIAKGFNLWSSAAVKTGELV